MSMLEAFQFTVKDHAEKLEKWKDKKQKSGSREVEKSKREQD